MGSLERNAIALPKHLQKTDVLIVLEHLPKPGQSVPSWHPLTLSLVVAVYYETSTSGHASGPLLMPTHQPRMPSSLFSLLNPSSPTSNWVP